MRPESMTTGLTTGTTRTGQAQHWRGSSGFKSVVGFVVEPENGRREGIAVGIPPCRPGAGDHKHTGIYMCSVVCGRQFTGRFEHLFSTPNPKGH